MILLGSLEESKRRSAVMKSSFSRRRISPTLTFSQVYGAGLGRGRGEVWRGLRGGVKGEGVRRGLKGG